MNKYNVAPSYQSPFSRAIGKLIDAKLNLDTFGLSSLKETDSQCEDDQGMRNQEKPRPSLGYAKYRAQIYKKIEEYHYTFVFKCERRAFVNSLATNETFKAR
jgi:hypothetical protein